MNKDIILLLFLLIPLSIRGQEDISIGKKYVLNSSALQEERTYWVHLPENYETNPAQAYPVIYLLDGELFFHSLVAINRMLSLGRGKRVTPGIIVGVLSTDRVRDLTPTASAAGRDGQIAPNALPEGGGSETFHHFLTVELRTVIDSAFRTNGRNMLIGHSFGGLFTLNTLLNHPGSFDTYLAIDPSLWWDQGRLSEDAGELIAGKDFTGKSLYLGIASGKRPERVSIHLNKADHFITNVLPRAKGLRFISKSFPDETHGTIAIPGMNDGMRQLLGR